MFVFYEEDGQFKAGRVMADNDASLQVEAASGKRSKIKDTAYECGMLPVGAGSSRFAKRLCVMRTT